MKGLEEQVEEVFCDIYIYIFGMLKFVETVVGAEEF